MSKPKFKVGDYLQCQDGLDIDIVRITSIDIEKKDYYLEIIDIIDNAWFHPGDKHKWDFDQLERDYKVHNGYNTELWKILYE